METDTLNRLLHSASVTLGAIIASSYSNLTPEAKADLITAFRNIRRHITVGEDGKRYGATEAARMIQGG